MSDQTTIKIQILSDLHLEAPKSYDIFTITPVAPYLALLGDIGCIKDPEYFTFLKTQLQNFKIVFLVLGNHEPYHSSWDDAKEKVRRFESELKTQPVEGYGRFVFLDQGRWDLDERVTILGCTLFSKVKREEEKAVSFGLNDFYHIKDWTVEEHRKQHAEDLRWLNEQVEKIGEEQKEREIVVFTHYSPTVRDEATEERFRGAGMGSGFATDLEGEVCWGGGGGEGKGEGNGSRVKAWVFGHTHWNCDFMVQRDVEKGGEIGKGEGKGMRVVTNQRGYYFQQAVGFEEGKCIEI